MSANGLSVNNIVPITVNISPAAVQVNSFGIMLCVGDSNVISGVERYRLYTDILGVAQDFGTEAPEYFAAVAYFSQSPAPLQLMIGRWLESATSGFLYGGILTSTEQEIANWDTIDEGSFNITIDGTVQHLTDLDFTAQTNLNGVAGVITGALTGATCTWSGSQFIVTSSSTGASSTVSYATPEGTGTDISAQLQLTSSTAYTPVPGFASETPVAAITALAEISNLWYACMFSCTVMPSNDQALAVAAFIEAINPAHVFGWNEMDARTLDPTWTSDMLYQLSNANYQHSLAQYSSDSDVAIASLIARQCAVDFNGNNTTITMKFKQEPGITGEVLTQTQANTIDTKRGNVFVEYQNDTFIIQQGVMSYNLYIDERWGIDWLTAAIQASVYNLLYTSTTKIPQTDAGNNQIQAAIESVLLQAINNGLIAPGVWNAAPFGNVQTGQNLPTGYAIYTPSIATQSQGDREARKSVTFQVGVKLAGAIHQVPILLNINR